MRLLCIILLANLSACTLNNVDKEPGLGKYFDENEVEGCFALYNNATDRFSIYNLERYRDSIFLPASTFKIVNALIGLQTGIIVNDSMKIAWDGIERQNAMWNRDLSMYEAFRVSAVNYFQEVARRIGKDTMELWLDTLGYAAGKDDTVFRIKTSVDSFWLDNSMKVTPDDQLGLVRRLYFGQLPFFKSNQEIVKRAMIMEDNSNYTLAFKTGWGFANDDKTRHIGWIVGWIEENRHPYFFVLNLESSQKDFNMQEIRMKILKDILRELGFLEGRM